MKSYLKTHPLQKMETEKTETTTPIDTTAADPTAATNADAGVTYGVTLPNREELVSLIKTELKYHGSHKLMLSIRRRLINAKALKDELRNKTHGTIVEILSKLER